MRWLDEVASALHQLSGRIRRWRWRRELEKGEAEWQAVRAYYGMDEQK